MQAAVVHDGGWWGRAGSTVQTETAVVQVRLGCVGRWNRDVGGGAESKWKEMHPSEQRAMPRADTRAGAAAAAWRASHAPVCARVVVLTVAGGSTGLVVYCTTHLPPGRPLQASQLHKASLLHLDVDRSNGCRTRGECWAAAGCVERTERVQLQRPPSICMSCLCMRGCGRKLVAIQTEAHACQQQSLVVCLAGSASATLSAQPPKSECVRQLVANIRSCPTFLAIVLTSSSNITRARSAAVSLGGGSRPSVGLKTACLGLDCHEFSSAPSHT